MEYFYKGDFFSIYFSNHLFILVCLCVYLFYTLDYNLMSCCWFYSLNFSSFSHWELLGGLLWPFNVSPSFCLQSLLTFWQTWCFLRLILGIFFPSFKISNFSQGDLVHFIRDLCSSYDFSFLEIYLLCTYLCPIGHTKKYRCPCFKINIHQYYTEECIIRY
jgi:hypothetical protein